MAINTLPAQSEVRQPRGIVKLNGELVAGCVLFSVDNNNFYSADTFRVEFAVNGMDSVHNPMWFSMQKDIEVELWAGFPSDPNNPQESELTRWIIGKVDDISFNPTSQRFELHGRDYSSVFIDTKTAPVAYKNQTSSQIATALAAAHGLSANVTPTKKPVGTYWNGDHVKLTSERSEWDLLTYLASEEMFVTYVKDKTLYFGPSPFLEAPTDFYILQWDAASSTYGSPQFNSKHIEFNRSLTIAKGVVVTAFSWNAEHKKVVTASYPKQARGISAGKANNSSAGSSGSQLYRKRLKDNLDILTVEKAAESLYHQIVEHEMKLRAVLPADNILTPEVAIKVEGTGTAYDQVYYPDNVTRTLSLDDGYQMEVRAKNLAPDTSAPV